MAHSSCFPGTTVRVCIRRRRSKSSYRGVYGFQVWFSDVEPFRRSRWVRVEKVRCQSVCSYSTCSYSVIVRKGDRVLKFWDRRGVLFDAAYIWNVRAKVRGEEAVWWQRRYSVLLLPVAKKRACGILIQAQTSHARVVVDRLTRSFLPAWSVLPLLLHHYYC